MGPRVRIVLIVVSLLAVAALAIPLAMSLADRRTSALAEERDRQLEALTESAAMPNAPLQRLVDRYYEVYGEGLLIIDSDGVTMAARELDLRKPGVARAATQAIVDAPAPRWDTIMPWDRRPLLAAASVQTNGELVGAVVLSVDTGVAADDIRTAWMWVGAGCLGFLLLAMFAARALITWVLRPLHGLERAVAEMTEGVAGAPADVAGPPELRHFTSAFNTMAQAVRASLARQRRLIADASHQLRNPLTAVRLRADSLEDHVTEAGWPTYESMSAELDRFEKLLAQLLRLARAEQLTGSRQMGLDAVSDRADLTDVIEERVAFWQPILDGQQQQLRYHHRPPGLTVQLARHDVEQLLDIPLENALRYAGPGAIVTVSIEQNAETVDVSVSDDGHGLSDDDLSRAAARFWRAHDDGAGTGLGLAIAAEITAGHGGSISVERAPEGGLLIRYCLPVADV